MTRFEDDMNTANSTQSDDSYDHVFQEHATAYYTDLNEMRATSHHRVIKYNYLDLQIVIQHEIDAYFYNCHTDQNRENEHNCSDGQAATAPTSSSSPDIHSALNNSIQFNLELRIELNYA